MSDAFFWINLRRKWPNTKHLENVLDEYVISYKYVKSWQISLNGILPEEFKGFIKNHSQFTYIINSKIILYKYNYHCSSETEHMVHGIPSDQYCIFLKYVFIRGIATL